MEDWKKGNTMIQVLIAEDNLDLRTIFTRVFSQAPFNTTSVSDGEQAIRHLQKAAPDVIILDIGMPRVSGLDVLNFMRNHMATHETKVIVVTGDHLNQYRDEMEMADLVLIKPVDVFVLRQFADRLTRSRLSPAK